MCVNSFIEDIPPQFRGCCSEEQPRKPYGEHLTYDPNSQKVFDEWGNLLGVGQLQGNTLTIKNKQKHMTRLHKFLFFFWRVKMYLKGVRKGTILKTYAADKNKLIEGVVLHLSGDSVSRKKVEFSIQIHWLEPLQGFDSRLYSSGVYFEKNIKGTQVYDNTDLRLKFGKA